MKKKDIVLGQTYWWESDGNWRSTKSQEVIAVRWAKMSRQRDYYLATRPPVIREFSRNAWWESNPEGDEKLIVTGPNGGSEYVIGYSSLITLAERDALKAASAKAHELFLADLKAERQEREDTWERFGNLFDSVEDRDKYLLDVLHSPYRAGQVQVAYTDRSGIHRDNESVAVVDAALAFADYLRVRGGALGSRGAA